MSDTRIFAIGSPDLVVVSDEAFLVLGLRSDASPEDVKEARRRLAHVHHPDLGGDLARMTAINEAAEIALRTLVTRREIHSDSSQKGPAPEGSTPAGAAEAGPADDWNGQVRDVASFTVEALPAEAFEGLLIAAACMGELIDDDPPYRLEASLNDPIRCWCRLELVPDAGACTVSLAIGKDDAQATLADLPNVDRVRDVWVDTLNEIDWP